MLLKQRIYVRFLHTDFLYIYWNLVRNRKVNGDQRMDETMDEKKKVRWRLDGYLQTENMEEKPRVLAS